MTTTKIETRHGVMAVDDSATDGFPVVFIHGNSASRSIFRNQVDADWAAGYRMITLDLLGHGDSEDASDPEAAYTQNGYADAIVDVLTELAVERAVVVGWSLGGHIALELIAKFPGLAGIVITGTPPANPETLGDAFNAGDGLSIGGTEVITEREAELYARMTAVPFEQAALDAAIRTDGRARKIMFDAFGAGRESDQKALVATASVPLAVIDGARDPFVNTSYVASLTFANLWEGTYHVIPGVGHAAFWEAPEVYNPLLQRFLGSFAQ
ncbi:alpha/beta fold hydrolase [Rhodococcus sp. NPDC060176]|uniref:alpha/beta fold hydrolase n=1 Tax=unclassified Rhodococcus (in: high G+C Gram-positive bacteria) TaxID=192944 RepID=UPI00365AF030